MVYAATHTSIILNRNMISEVWNTQTKTSNAHSRNLALQCSSRLTQAESGNPQWAFWNSEISMQWWLQKNMKIWNTHNKCEVIMSKMESRSHNKKIITENLKVGTSKVLNTNV